MCGTTTISVCILRFVINRQLTMNVEPRRTLGVYQIEGRSRCAGGPRGLGVGFRAPQLSQALAGSYRGICRMIKGGRCAVVICVLITSVPPVGAQDQWGEASKAITRLSPAAFPDLPLPVRDDLEKRGCRVPQSAWNPKPHNVISGQFIRPHHIDWAVLCSKNGSSTVLVFVEGSPTRVQSFDPADDKM